jgi:pimeloyl-ACP methyl ester carboxylesterase
MSVERILGLLSVVLLVAGVGGCLAHRKLLYFPSHDPAPTDLTPWVVGRQVIGFTSAVDDPETVWLMLHGNGGQASQRGYASQRMNERDALFVMEYPGYGARPGKPTRDAFNAAAAEALAELRRRFPDKRFGVIGESIGTGPASWLGSQSDAPDKIVLVVPFDRLERVAKAKFPYLPVGMIMRDKWDNAAALKGYAGELEIYGAADDQIIPVAHARDLAAALPGAKFSVLPGGHNAWSYQSELSIGF